MSPRPFSTPASTAVVAAVRRAWVDVGQRIHDARLARHWTVVTLADRAGVSRAVAYLVEAGEPTSVEAVARLAGALGLRVEVELTDPRRRIQMATRRVDPVHSAMGEFEAAQLRQRGFPVGIDEPYQYYQFAGRADVAAWDAERCALLHIENRTRFPDFQEMAGSYNAKRAYLSAALAVRAGVVRWASETHVIAALWSSEVVHALRIRTESFRAVCPDPPDRFAAWLAGEPPPTGVSSSLVVIDPLAGGRRRVFAGLDQALVARSRVRGYANAAIRLGATEPR